ncbi:MAG: hypothetical protein Q7J34_00235 [Bacteroidales bacterium]|nr:hypothetical protein [Bacteroidales bacterium]
MNKKIAEKFMTFIGIGLFFIAFNACDKVKELASFDVVVDIPPQTIIMQNALKNGLTEQYYEFNAYVNLDSIQQAHNLTSFTLESGKIREAKLTIIAPEGQNFDFLLSSRISLFSSEIAENVVAHTGNLTPGATSLIFIIDQADLTQLIKSQTFHGKLYYDTNSALMPATPVINQLELKIEFTINPL